jgi:hypothetical protein
MNDPLSYARPADRCPAVCRELVRMIDGAGLGEV